MNLRSPTGWPGRPQSSRLCQLLTSTLESQPETHLAHRGLGSDPSPPALYLCTLPSCPSPLRLYNNNKREALISPGVCLLSALTSGRWGFVCVCFYCKEMTCFSVKMNQVIKIENQVVVQIRKSLKVNRFHQAGAAMLTNSGQLV